MPKPPSSSSQADLTLLVQQEGRIDQEVFLQHGITIGRASSNMICIEDSEVEHIHARVLRQADGSFILQAEDHATFQAVSSEDGSTQTTDKADLQADLVLQIGKTKITCRKQKSHATTILAESLWEAACPRCQSVISDQAEAEQTCSSCSLPLFHHESKEFTGWLPRKVGSYEIRKFVAKGGMGVVLRGIHEESDQMAAIKLPHPELVKDERWARRFEGEIKTLERLVHPNLVRLQASGREESLMWLAMDWVEGESLSGKIGRGLGVEEVRSLMEQAVKGLGVLHGKGIVHRDLKPSNLLVGADGALKLADFGLAKAVEGEESMLTRTGTLAGTGPYMAPEQWQGLELSEATDVYALGIIWHELLTGKRPQLGEVATEGISLPPGWESMLEKCFRNKPSERPVLQELEECLSGKKRAGGVGSQKETRTKGRGIMPWAAVLVLGAVVGLGYWMSKGPVDETKSAGSTEVAEESKGTLDEIKPEATKTEPGEAMKPVEVVMQSEPEPKVEPIPQPVSRVIAYTPLTLSNPFFKVIGDHITAEAAKNGYDTLMVDPDMDVKKQSDQFYDFISSGVTAIILVPCDRLSIGPAVKAANAEGIPVFTVDAKCAAEGAEIAGHVGTDNFQGGELAGQAMIKALGENGGKVLILDFKKAHSCVLRVAGFKKVIDAHNAGRTTGNIEIVAELNGNGARTGGYKSTADAIELHDDLAGVFAINDPSALGAYVAIEEARKEDQIKIIGFDGQLDGKQAIKDGKIFADPIQHPDKMGQQVVQNIMKYLAGEEYEKDTLIPATLYDKNAADKDPIFSGNNEVQESIEEEKPIRVVKASETEPEKTVHTIIEPKTEKKPATQEPFEEEKGIPRYKYLNPPLPNSGDRQVAKDYFDDGDVAQKREEWKRAKAAYLKAAKADPAWFDARFELGQAAYYNGDTDLALQSFEHALSIEPNDGPARFNFAKSLVQGNYYADAARELETFLQFDPDNAQAHFEAGRLYAQELNDVARAAVHYKRVIGLKPGHPQAATIRYWLIRNKTDQSPDPDSSVAESISKDREAKPEPAPQSDLNVEVRPDGTVKIVPSENTEKTDVLIQEAEGLSQTKEWDEALAKLQEAQNFADQNQMPIIMANMGDVHYAKGEHKEAVDLYLKAAEQGYAYAQFSLGFMHQKGEGVAKDYSIAFHWTRKAANQGHVQAQYNLGVFHMNGWGTNANGAKASEWFQKAADNGHVKASQMPGVKKTTEETNISLTAGDNTEQETILDLSEVDREPRPLVRIPPQYPPKLLLNRVSGRVDLLIVIDEEGRVTDHQVRRFTHAAFTLAVTRVIKQWKFSPAIKDGKPVAVRKIQPFYFGEQE